MFLMRIMNIIESSRGASSVGDAINSSSAGRRRLAALLCILLVVIGHEPVYGRLILGVATQCQARNAMPIVCGMREREEDHDNKNSFLLSHPVSVSSSLIPSHPLSSNNCKRRVIRWDGEGELS